MHERRCNKCLECWVFVAHYMLQKFENCDIHICHWCFHRVMRSSACKWAEHDGYKQSEVGRKCLQRYIPSKQ